MVNKMRESGDLFDRFEAQAHALIVSQELSFYRASLVLGLGKSSKVFKGLYCWLIRLPDDADRHFQAALRVCLRLHSYFIVSDLPSLEYVKSS